MENFQRFTVVLHSHTLLKVFVFVSILSSSVNARNLSMSFIPLNEITVLKDSTNTLEMNISVNLETNSCRQCPNSSWILKISTGNAAIADVATKSSPQSSPQSTQGISVTFPVAKNVFTDAVDVATYNVTLRGVQLGRTVLTFTLESSPVVGLLDRNKEKYRVRVIRVSPVSREILSIIFAVVVGLAQFMFALSLEPKKIFKHVKKPLILLLGFLCQYGLMPPLSYGIVKLLSLRPSFAVALFIVGCCPGGGASNQWSLLLDGDVNLSALMTLISNIMALGMMPLWLFALRRTLGDSDITIPFANIAITLISLVIPIFLGMLFRHFIPKVAKVILKVIRPILLIMLLAAMAVGLYNSSSLFSLFTWKLVLASILLAYTGYLLGFLLGLLTTRSLVVATTVAIETGMQNNGIALVVILATFPLPESEIGSLVPGCIVTVTPIPFIIALVVKVIRNRCCKKESVDDDDADDVDQSKGDVKDQDESVRGSEISVEMKKKGSIYYIHNNI